MKAKYDKLLSNLAFKCNLRHYSEVSVTLLITLVSGVPILEKAADEKWGRTLVSASQLNLGHFFHLKPPNSCTHVLIPK